MNLWPLAVLTASAFVATNVDNLVLLFAFLSDKSYQASRVLLGYALGMVAILALAKLLATAADLFPPQYVGFLGVIPLGIGLRKGYLLIAHRGRPLGAADLPGPSHHQVLAVALADVAHGSDSILVYSTLMADTVGHGDYVIMATYLLVVAAWCGLAWWLFNAPRVNALTQRYAHVLSPTVLIAVGGYVLLDTMHDVQ